MFFDALNPFIYADPRAFYVFYPVFTDFRGVLQKLNSGSTLPKDKAASRRQCIQYSKASQRSILAKEAAIGYPEMPCLRGLQGIRTAAARKARQRLPRQT